MSGRKKGGQGEGDGRKENEGRQRMRARTEETEKGEQKRRERERELASWCFEPSQPQRITSGLRERGGGGVSFATGTFPERNAGGCEDKYQVICCRDLTLSRKYPQGRSSSFADCIT